jgi:AcrR family transcriptional regulator
MPKVVPEYKEQARMRIIEQALEMFSERGFYNTRMVDIADSLDVSKGAIYQYFESKEQLFVEALRHHGEKRANVVRGVLESDSLESISTGEFFDKMLELRLGSLTLTTDLIRVVTRNDELRKMLVGLVNSWGGGLVELFNEMKRVEAIRADVDSSTLSRGILALRDGLYGHLTMGADRIEVRETWVVMMGYIMNNVVRV